DRGEGLGDEVEGDAEEAYGPVARVEPHAAVVPDRLVDDSLPALALRDQFRDRVRALGHADEVGEAEDGVVPILAQEVLVRAKGQLDVLAREPAGVAAELLEDIPAPD